MSSVGSIVGFNVPQEFRKRKKKVDEVLERHNDIKGFHVVSFFSSLDESKISTVTKLLDEGKIDEVADQVREYVVRLIVRSRLSEVVRKKPGGGGYVLYSPNQGKKKQSHPVGAFPTKLAAKRAELARFAPKDPARRERLKKEVERLSKKKVKKEEMFRGLIAHLVSEALFRENDEGSNWDEHLSKLSRQAVAGDKKLQNMQRNIERKTETALENALSTIAKATKGSVKIKNHGVKKGDGDKIFIAFDAIFDDLTAGPILIQIVNGVPKIDVTSSAKVQLTKGDPEAVKRFRAELITVQERILDEVDDIHKAVASRDKYLDGLQNEVDSIVNEMDPLQISILKNLLVKKYRKT